MVVKTKGKKCYQLKHIWRTVKEQKRRQAQQKAFMFRAKREEDAEFKRRINSVNRVYGGSMRSGRTA